VFTIDGPVGKGPWRLSWLASSESMRPYSEAAWLIGQRQWLRWRWPWMTVACSRPSWPNAGQNDLYSLSRSWADLVAASRTKHSSQPSTGHRHLHPLQTWACMASNRLMPSCRRHRRLPGCGRFGGLRVADQATLPSRLEAPDAADEPHADTGSSMAPTARPFLRSCRLIENRPESLASDVSERLKTEISTPTYGLSSSDFDLA